MKLLAIVMMLLITPRCLPQCTAGTSGTASYVFIAPTDGLGRALDPGTFSIKEFKELKSKKNETQLFGRNKRNDPLLAEHVPHGTYRIKIQARPDRKVFGRLIDVCQKGEFIEVPNQFARVHVVLLTTTDSYVEDAGADLVRVAEFRNLDGTNMTSLFNGAVANEVPYGSYNLKVYDPLGGEIERNVNVFQPDVWVFSGFFAFGEYGEYSAPVNVVRGRVENIPPNERPVFVTLSGVYDAYMINSTVSDTGSGTGKFSFNGMNPRAFFMLFTIGRSGVLDAREIKLPRETEVTVDLSHPSPPKTDVP